MSAQNIELSGNLFVSGSSTLSESLDVSGDVTMDGTLDVSGDAFFGSDLDVSGDVVVDGTLDVSGEAFFGSDLDVSGDVVVDGTLDVSGTTTLKHNLDVSGDVAVDGNVGIGGGHSSEKLKVYGDVNITGNINVDGSFSFSEVVQNTTTVNNTLLVSTQLDISNEGTGPALKVSQLGDGDDQDVALFNAGDEGDALKIDSSGNTFVYKDIDISGHTTLNDVSCNGNIDICGGSLTIVGNISNDPIMTIRKNDDGVVFNTIVIRRPSGITGGDNEAIGARELQLWVNGDNILVNNSSVLSGYFILWPDYETNVGYAVRDVPTLYNDNITNVTIIAPPHNLDPNGGIIITNIPKINTNDIQSIVYYNRIESSDNSAKAIGLRLELYNRDNDPSLSSPVAFTNTIETAADVYRFGFPAISTYPSGSFVSADSTTNIVSESYAQYSTDITFNDTRRTGLKIENANIDVDGAIITNNIKMSNDIDSFLETLPSAYSQNSYNTFGSFDGSFKWAGGVLAPNGKIYGIPSTSTTILEIDPVNQTASTFGSFTGCRGGVLAPNGKIYGIGSTTILEIDPETKTTSTFGSFSGGWAGGVLAPNGKIYGIPSGSTTILEIDPINQTASTFGSFSGNNKWVGGVLAPNGKIYGIPRDSTTILVIDPENPQNTTTFGSFSGNNKWLCGVLAPNGKIYGIPFGSTTILEIDPENHQNTTTFGSLSGSGKWFGGVLAPNGKIYGIPYSSTTILEIDPINQTASTFGSFSGDGKWTGGVLAPNGKIYGIPANSSTILEIVPSRKYDIDVVPQWMLEAYFNKF